ncbi:825_t:CDS:1, partial [Racocetra fulgida]
MSWLYNTLAKTPIFSNLNHLGRGKHYLNEAREARDQKNLISSFSAYDKAIKNLEKAYNNHSTYSDIEEILTQTRKEFEEIKKELYLFERNHPPNREPECDNFIGNKFFQNNYCIPEKNLSLDEDKDPRNTQQLACELHRRNLSNEQKKELCKLALEIIERFAKRESTTLELVHEVMALAHLPEEERELYKNLVNIFIKKIKNSDLFFPSLLEGLSHIIRQANPNHREADDLVGILEVLNEKFKNLRAQDQNRQIEMLRILGGLFDAMADCKVQDLEYETLYKPLYDTLKELKSNSNHELAYHAKYACQALICIPTNKSPWKEFLQFVQGIAKLAVAVRNIDPGKLPDAFKELSEGLESIKNVIETLVDLVKEIQSAKEASDDIKQIINWEIQHEWYRALRFTDLFIQSQKFASLEQFIYKIPCRKDDKFLWGLCERLGRIVADSELNIDIRKGAINFLNNIRLNKDHWGYHPELDKWNKWILEPTELKISASSFPTILLGEILVDKHVRLTQLNDLKESRKEMPDQLNELKNQFFSDVDNEFEEAMELYVKPQGTWKVSIIKRSDGSEEMTSEDVEGDVEEVVYRFFKSKDELNSNDKEALEVAINKLSNSKDVTSIIDAVNSCFAIENKLTLEDESILKQVANQFLDLKVNKASKLQEIITNKFLHSSMNKELLTEVINNVLKENPIILEDEDIKFLEREANKYSNLNDKSNFESAVNKFLAFKAEKKLKITINGIVASKCKMVLLILGVGGTGKSTFGRYLARRLWQEYGQFNTLQSPIPLFIPLARLKEGMFNSNEDFIELYLKEKCKLSSDKINALRERKFIIILDGYDEIVERESKCYIKNQFNKWKNAKIIISCRPEYL